VIRLALPFTLLATVFALTGATRAQPSAARSPGGAGAIHARLEARITGFGGTLGVAALDLKTGEQIAINADARFPTASLIKVPVMVEVYHQIAAGTLRRDTSVTVTERDKVGDESVVLNQLHGGLVVSVTAKVDERMVAYGLAETKLFRPTFRDGRADVFPELEREFGLGMTTPREMAKLFALIAEGKIVNRAVSDEMIGLLDRQQDRAMIPRSLPYARDRVLVANKTGWDEEKATSGAARRIRDTDWGVDNDALRTGAAISREIYDYFAERR
jgi:beta-lactamase class A